MSLVIDLIPQLNCHLTGCKTSFEDTISVFDSEDDYDAACQNVSHCHQQIFSELHSPR